MVTHEQLKKHLHYDPATGVFTRLVRTSPRINIGDIAGSMSRHGYWRVWVGGRQYFAHRLAWLYVHGEWPKHIIDHIDGDPLNNRIANLRDVSVSMNAQNQKRAQPHNALGLLGVGTKGRRFHARIGLNNKTTHLGVFDTPEQAHEAYLVAKRKYHEGCTI